MVLRCRPARRFEENRESALNAMKSESLDCIYDVPGGGGSIAIANADYAEQLNETLANTAVSLRRLDNEGAGVSHG